MPSLTALRCLDASARLGSFTRAAHELHLTQSAISHHILSLERQFGVKLFERISGGLQLSVPGRTYWEATAAALEQLQRATRQLQAKGDSLSLTISAPPSFTQAWLMRRVCDDFVVHNPAIRLELVNRMAMPASMYEDLDAAIELAEGDAPETTGICLLSLNYSPYAAPSLLRRLGIADTPAGGVLPLDVVPRVLASSILIRTSMADAWHGWLERTGLTGCTEPSRVSEGPLYAQATLALIAALNGNGVALLPKHVAAGDHAAGNLVRLSGIGWPASKAYRLQWPALRPVSPALRRFAEWATIIAESEEEG